MDGYYEMLGDLVGQVRDITSFVPETALVLGSGLGELGDEVCAEAVVEYCRLKGFPVSTVSGHKGRFVFGKLEGVPVVIMQGRIHYYEGYTMRQVVTPVRLMKLLGAKKLILTNAAGGINRSFSAGDLMLITGHIGSFVPSPLVGPNEDALGVRFPDMSEIYCRELQRTAENAAAEEGIVLRRGVYLQTSGPNYETPEEILMYEKLGADAVGMSTACEATAAVHCGMKVCGISCITNKAAGISEKPLSHEEVKVAADRVASDFKRLIRRILKDSV